MKELNTYKCICLILLFLAPFFGLVKAQTCDPNILKALSETRVTYFDKVTTGQVGSLSIKYPMMGLLIRSQIKEERLFPILIQVVPTLWMCLLGWSMLSVNLPLRPKKEPVSIRLVFFTYLLL